QHLARDAVRAWLAEIDPRAGGGHAAAGLRRKPDQAGRTEAGLRDGAAHRRTDRDVLRLRRAKLDGENVALEAQPGSGGLDLPGERPDEDHRVAERALPG